MENDFVKDINILKTINIQYFMYLNQARGRYYNFIEAFEPKNQQEFETTCNQLKDKLDKLVTKSNQTLKLMDSVVNITNKFEKFPLNYTKYK